MKIGILTFHKVTNAGANLQAYSTIKYLCDNGYDAELIDFIPNSSIDHRSWKRKILHTIKFLLSPKTRRLKKQSVEFIKFQKKYLKVSSISYFGDIELLNSKLKYDVIISGSDQVLNLPLSGYSFSFYLPFEKVKKISYGSSFGRENISDIEKWAILYFLPKFDYLSFREESGYEIVNNLIDLRYKNIVVDPVFLLDKKEWRSLVANKKEKRKYIFVYLMENSKWVENTINFVSEKYPAFDIIVMCGSDFNVDISKKVKKVKIISPSIFLSFVDDSEIVITNSFHGLAFSLIFEKKLYCCAHSSKNTRLLNLLKMVNEECKLISKDSNNYHSINGEEAYKRMNNAIENSKNYIKNSLENKNDR